MARGYTSVSIPDSLLNEIDEILKKKYFGYKTRSEFVKEALRFHILRVQQAESLRGPPP
jgi:metal-responsive CopG/Arc/MetJ family transcriptional regulator